MTEGEAWARELLTELRADAYRPDAWRRFLARSFERARATRRQRAVEHRQLLLVAVAGLASWASVLALRPWLAMAGALWWLLVVAMVDWHLGMLEDEHGQPQRRLGLPNLLVLARAATVPALLVASPPLLAALLIPAGVTDAIDGRLARRRQQETRLGVWLDGSVDTLVLSAAAVGCARDGLLPWWIAGVVVARHLAPWLLVSLAYFVRATPPPRDSLAAGKAAGLIIFSGLVLASLHLPAAVPIVVLGAAAGLATLGLRLTRAQPFRAQPGLQPPA